MTLKPTRPYTTCTRFIEGFLSGHTALQHPADIPVCASDITPGTPVTFLMPNGTMATMPMPPKSKKKIEKTS